MVSIPWWEWAELQSQESAKDFYLADCIMSEALLVSEQRQQPETPFASEF